MLPVSRIAIRFPPDRVIVAAEAQVMLAAFATPFRGVTTPRHPTMIVRTIPLRTLDDEEDTTGTV